MARLSGAIEAFVGPLGNLGESLASPTGFYV